MHAAALAPRDIPSENARIAKSSLITGAVSGAVAAVLGFDPLSVGLLTGGAAWLWGKGKQLLR